jgi:SAM-dependent methyltransferase
MIKGDLLHVGCGSTSLPFWAEGAKETRLDIDPQWNPDILASLTDMGDIGEYDIIYTCHTLEHLYPDEVPKALSEFKRVLKEDGVVIIFVPDLEDIKADYEPLYETEAGPVTGMDMIYGKDTCVEYSRYMAHHTGFTSSSLKECMIRAGFTDVSTERLAFNVFCAAKKPKEII